MNCICENCGKEFTEDYRVRKDLSTARFCSKSCRAKFNGKRNRGILGHPNYNHKGCSENSNLNLPCPYCGSLFGNAGGLQRHVLSCKLNPDYEKIKATGKYTWKIHNEKWRQAMDRGFIKEKSPTICKYCGRLFSYKDHCHRHEKYCKLNPERVPFPSHSQSDEAKRKLSLAAKRNHFGGQFSRKDINYNGVILNSSYEFTVAESLDKNNIKWIRPKKLKWTDKENKIHEYQADFYLPDYDVYLDPKNDYLINNINSYFGIPDKEKIDRVCEQNNVRVLILNKDNLSWVNILNKISEV